MLLDSRNFSVTSIPTMPVSQVPLPRPGLEETKTILTKREHLFLHSASATTSEFRTAILKGNT